MARNNRAQNDNNEGRKRGTFLVSLASNLVANAFIMTRKPELKFLARKVEELGASTGTLIAFQSGIEALIDESGLPSPVQIVAEDILDKLFIGLRSLPPDATDSAKQQSLETGGATMLSFMKGKFKKEPEQRGSQFPKHEAGLEATPRKTLFDWDKKLRATGQRGLKQWLYYREMIDSVDRLAYLISLDEADRLPYLESIYGKAPEDGAAKPKPGALGVLKSVKDVVEGKASAASADIEARIATTTAEVEELGNEQKEKAIAIRKANKLPQWLMPAILVAFLFGCVVGLTILNNLIK